MEFDLSKALPVLTRTPGVLDALLRDLPGEWIMGTEGPETWSPFDVVGHLIHGDRTDWMPRVEHLLEFGETIPFPAFDRFAQFEASQGKSMSQLLENFRQERTSSLARLTALGLTAPDLERTGTHPAFGCVTLSELLATWVAHDLDHIAQIARVMGRQYTDAVGPWRQYLRVIGPA
jgi:hypothetical protein